MTAVFFDLETTDTAPIGQILNYCFIAVDGALNPVAEESGTVSVSRLQLPRAGALLANRTDILKHQETAQYTELEAMRRIVRFIDDLVRQSQVPVQLIGFNSVQFDLPYLRTSLIRNGINPYFSGKVIYKDLLFLARKAACCLPEFPRTAKPDGKEARLALSLEHLSRELGLLQGAQSHESREDVLLSIELARCLQSRFGLDIRKFEAYELPPGRHGEFKGKVLWQSYPNYDLSVPERNVLTPVTLLDFNHRYALWINLEQFKLGRGRECITWVNQSSACFFCDGVPDASAEWQTIAGEALSQFQGINLRNFFPESSCDIEQDIYRLDFDAIRALALAIQGDKRQLDSLPGRDGKVLYLRWRLTNYRWGEGDDERVRSLLRQYALYRYGGKAQMVKQLPVDGTQARTHHPMYPELLEELESLAREAGPDDARILTALREFYRISDIYSVAGEELEALSKSRNFEAEAVQL